MEYPERGNEAKANARLAMSFSKEDKDFKVLPILIEKLLVESKATDWI